MCIRAFPAREGSKKRTSENKNMTVLKSKSQKIQENLKPKSHASLSGPAVGCTWPLCLEIEAVLPNSGLNKCLAVFQAQETGPLADDIVVAAHIDLKGNEWHRWRCLLSTHETVDGAVGTRAFFNLRLDASSRGGVGLLVHQILGVAAGHAILVLSLELSGGLVEQDGYDMTESGDHQDWGTKSKGPFTVGENNG
jgi:hypothetical protein